MMRRLRNIRMTTIKRKNILIAIVVASIIVLIIGAAVLVVGLTRQSTTKQGKLCYFFKNQSDKFFGGEMIDPEIFDPR